MQGGSWLNACLPVLMPSTQTTVSESLLHLGGKLDPALEP